MAFVWPFPVGALFGKEGYVFLDCFDGVYVELKGSSEFIAGMSIFDSRLRLRIRELMECLQTMR